MRRDMRWGLTGDTGWLVAADPEWGSVSGDVGWGLAAGPDGD